MVGSSKLNQKSIIATIDEERKIIRKKTLFLIEILVNEAVRVGVLLITIRAIECLADNIGFANNFIFKVIEQTSLGFGIVLWFVLSASALWKHWKIIKE